MRFAIYSLSASLCKYVKDVSFDIKSFIYQPRISASRFAPRFVQRDSWSPRSVARNLMPDDKSSGAGTLSRGRDDRATFGKIRPDRPAVVGQDFQKKTFDGNRAEGVVCEGVCARKYSGSFGMRARARCKFPSGYVLHRVKGNKFVRGCVYSRLAAPENRAVK